MLADAAAFDAVDALLGDRVVRARPRPAASLGVATDGSAAHVRALLDEVDPDRRRGRALRASTSATLDDVFLALTGHPGRDEPTMPRRPCRCLMRSPWSARCVRLSLRNVDALITSLMLPVMLMLMFVYLFGGAIDTGTRLRRPTSSPA